MTSSLIDVENCLVSSLRRHFIMIHWNIGAGWTPVLQGFAALVVVVAMGRRGLFDSDHRLMISELQMGRKE